jgi:acetylglutamate kinase
VRFNTHSHMPVTSLHPLTRLLCRSGQVLNINADVAARELAIQLKPVKVVFISAGGGWKEGMS